KAPDGQVVSKSNKLVKGSVWDLPANKIICELGEQNQSATRALVYTPQGDEVVSLTSWNGLPTDPECLIQFWDARTGAERKCVRRPATSRLFSLAMSPDGRSFALGGTVKTVEICDTDTGKPIIDLST